MLEMTWEDPQCPACGWLGSDHCAATGACPPPRPMCGSCDAGLPMACICPTRPEEPAVYPCVICHTSATSDGLCDRHRYTCDARHRSGAACEKLADAHRVHRGRDPHGRLVMWERSR